MNSADKFGVDETAAREINKIRKFYDNYSHPSLLSLTSLYQFDETKQLFMGASFDNAKIPQYKKEINIRINLANLISNIIDGISIN